MTADVEQLRRAAEQIRELANECTPAPWGVGNRIHIGSGVEQTGSGSFTYEWMIAEVEDDDYRDYGGVRGWDEDVEPVGSAEADAQHIASWDPAVARAVADLLDAGAEEVACRVVRDGEEILERANPVFHAMRELARTYLGEDA